MSERTYDELVQLHQSGKITWLQLVEQSEDKDDFIQWCKDHNVKPDDNYAELYLEQTEGEMSFSQGNWDSYEKLQGQ